MQHAERAARVEERRHEQQAQRQPHVPLVERARRSSPRGRAPSPSAACVPCHASTTSPVRPSTVTSASLSSPEQVADPPVAALAVEGDVVRAAGPGGGGARSRTSGVRSAIAIARFGRDRAAGSPARPARPRGPARGWAAGRVAASAAKAGCRPASSASAASANRTMAILASERVLRLLTRIAHRHLADEGCSHSLGRRAPVICGRTGLVKRRAPRFREAPLGRRDSLCDVCAEAWCC